MNKAKRTRRNINIQGNFSNSIKRGYLAYDTIPIRLLNF